MDVEEILKALASPARVEILKWLKEPDQHFSGPHISPENGVCAGQFKCTGLSQSTVSAHLATLQRSGLITATRSGQWIFYKRNEDVIQSFLKELNASL